MASHLDTFLFGDGLLVPIPTLLSGDDGAINSVPIPTLLSGLTGAINSVPIPTLVSNDGNVARLSVPIPTLVADDLPFALLAAPAPTLSATGLGGSVGISELFVPAPDLVAEGSVGNILTVIETLPVPTLAMEVNDIVLDVPVPLLSALLLSGTIITVTATAPAPILLADNTNSEIITAANTVAIPLLSAALAAGNVADAAALIARAPSLSAAGLTGTVSTAELEAITPIMAAAGYTAYTLTFANTVPAPFLNAVMDATLSENYRTWVINTRKLAATEYNFAFNSYAVFNGKIIAASAAGVVELGTQNLDDAATITARARTGAHDYESSLLKRIPRAYLNYKGGEMVYRSITSEGGTRSYALHDNFVQGLTQRRIPIGRGPKSRTWSHEVENVAGSDFSIEGVLIYPVILRRRVQ